MHIENVELHYKKICIIVNSTDFSAVISRIREY